MLINIVSMKILFNLEILKHWSNSENVLNHDIDGGKFS